MVKKLLVVLISALMLVSLVACSGNEYNVTVIDDDGLLYEPVQTRHEAGEQVAVKTKILYDADIECYVNGKSLGTYEAIETNGVYSHWQFCFEMPAEDVTITFEVKDGFLFYDDMLNITYEDTDNALYQGYEPITSARSSEEVTVKVKKLNDADVLVYLNGERLIDPPIEYDDYNLYQFTMPNENTTVLLDIVSDTGTV